MKKMEESITDKLNRSKPMLEKLKGSNPAKESTYGLIKENMMENGQTISKMEKASSFMQMELCTTVTGLMGLRTEKACKIGKMAQNTKEIG